MDFHDLAERIGAGHVQRRLATEAAHEAQVFGHGLLIFNVENWKLAPSLVKCALLLSGLYGRAQRNASQIVVRRTDIRFKKLPQLFDGFTILQVSDLHADISQEAMKHLVSIVGGLKYDISVFTGDYRGKTYGPFDDAIAITRELCRRLKPNSLYGVLGNHDSIKMNPSLEAMGIRMLFNECVELVRGDERIYLAGVDDAHFYRADDVEKASSKIPATAFSVLLSHTPEIYDQAAGAGFDLMLSGHTHGGQLCLPGGIPIKLEAVIPRSMGVGTWRHAAMVGYTSSGAGTSLLPVRLNCPAEITLHTLRTADLESSRV
jgi:uncharacterized protein